MEKMAFCIEDLKKVGLVKTEMSSPTLRWPRVKAMEEMQSNSCSRKEESEVRRRAGERAGRGLALLTTIVAFFGLREKERWSWW